MISLERTRDRVFRWALALTLVGAAHGAALAWVLRPPPEDNSESQTGGAFIIELAPITASVEEEHRDVAIGKRSEEVMPVLASAPKVASSGEPQPDELPALPETSATPEDAIPKKPEEKPPEEEKPAEVNTKAEDAPLVAPVEAREAAAPRKIDNATQVADQPAGQNVGLSRLDRKTIENWRRDLIIHMNRHKRYPAEARAARQYGVTSIAFTINREGRVLRAAIAKSAGYEILDAAAVELLNRASPLPAPPASVAGETIEFVVPVNYRWKD